MRVAVTGTPGTGKTSAVAELETDLSVIHLNQVIEEEGFYTEIDEDRDSLVADLDAIREWLADRDDVIVESHLAHYLEADAVIVLRCHPEILAERLEARGEPTAKARENAESEALDGILIEAADRHDRSHLFEIDTTDLSTAETATEIQQVISGERAPSAGTVDFTEYLAQRSSDSS